MAGRTPAAGGRLPLGKAVGQAWALWLAGLLALIGGLALLVNPGAGLRLVKWTLGLFLVGWGVLRLVHAFSGPRRDRTWLVLSGLCILGAGIVVLVWPGVTVTALLYILVVGGLCLASVDLVGAFVGSFVVGFLYNFGIALFPDLAYFILFLPMVLVLVFMPQGLFGRVPS